MSQDNSTGEKTEKPTPKKLRDARKDGNVAKSHDLSQTITTFIWALLLISLGGFFSTKMSALLEKVWASLALTSTQAMLDIVWLSAITLLWLTVVPLGLVGAIGVFIEFIQVGPVFSFKKINPNFGAINPVQGIKRIFSIDNFFEVAKAIFKTTILIIITLSLLLYYLDDIVKLPQGNLFTFIRLDKNLLFLLTFWVAVLFSFFSIGDWLYQRYSHEKKLRMSKYDIKQEHKSQEGDPQLKGQRKQLQKQWANQQLQQAARSASAVVVNPTHIAVALYYQPNETVVPIITAKGEGPVARLIRETAEDEGVPIMRNITLARQLNYRGEEDDYIPEDLFEAVAEVLAWAESVKSRESELKFKDIEEDFKN